VLLDYERYCDSGCRYRYPSVKKTLIVPRWRHPQSFYVWTFVEDTKNSEWFSHVTVKRHKDRTVVLFDMIKDKRIKKLERATGKPHDPVFETCTMRYEVREQFKDGRFHNSVLTFTGHVEVTGLIAIFSGAVRSGLADTWKAILDNVRKGARLRQRAKHHSGLSATTG
jgi:hypothetical protein